jgi:hypothetical protein
MTTIHLHAHAGVTPEQFIAALTDFGPGRSETFGNSADNDLQVHSVHEDHADVTEGSRGIWERLTYDWSDPNHVVLTTTDSNAWGGHSGHTYDLTRRDDGSTDIDYTIVRDGKNLRGRLVGAFLRIGGKRVLAKAFQDSIRSIESRNGHGSPA